MAIEAEAAAQQDGGQTSKKGCCKRLCGHCCGCRSCCRSSVTGRYRLRTEKDNFRLWCAQGKAKAIQALLDKEKAGTRVLDINSATDMGYTSLHAASRSGHTEVVRMLLEAEADADSVTLAGLSPLMLAAAGGHAEVALLILQKAPDIAAIIASARRERTARDFALDFGHQEIATMIDSHGPKKADFTHIGQVKKKSKFNRRAVKFDEEAEDSSVSSSNSTPIRRKPNMASAFSKGKAKAKASQSSLSSAREGVSSDGGSDRGEVVSFQRNDSQGDISSAGSRRRKRPEPIQEVDEA